MVHVVMVYVWCITPATGHITMRWDEVVRAFTKLPWALRGNRRYMYIYERGTVTALPGVPAEWYKSFIPWVERGCVTCTYGLDWWFEEKRVRINNEVEHGILFSMDDVFYHHVRENWFLMEGHRRRNASSRNPTLKNLPSMQDRVCCSRDIVYLPVTF